MHLRAFDYHYHPLHFIQPATTSRDVLTEKPTWIIRIELEEEGVVKTGFGEVSIIEGLSVESVVATEKLLKTFQSSPKLVLNTALHNYPGVRFGLEMALMDAQAEAHQLFPSPFTSGTDHIKINGLVWMAPVEDMRKQVGEKIAAGFDCVKLKIGALDWEKERELIAGVREKYSASDITIRVDANGAFTQRNPHQKLEQLAALDVHSIEQVVAPGHRELHRDLCLHGAIPCALDEELIGVNQGKEREELLDQITPNYLILKPSLLGGFESCDDWIALAEERNIAWWATSALESNLGLSAIAQWCYTKNNPLHQGLGTGALYHNNFEAPLKVSAGKLSYEPTNWFNFDQLWSGK